SFTDEYTAGLDYGLSRGASVRVNFIRKRDRQGRLLVNSALPFEAYTDVRTSIDPGPDNRLGTADDSTIRVYSLPTTNPNLGKLVGRRVNVTGAGNEMYSGIETTFNKRYSNRWTLLASYQADFQKVRGGLPQNPNELLYPTSAPFWDHTMKLVGTYDLPLRF